MQEGTCPAYGFEGGSTPQTQPWSQGIPCRAANYWVRLHRGLESKSWRGSGAGPGVEQPLTNTAASSVRLCTHQHHSLRPQTSRPSSVQMPSPTSTCSPRPRGRQHVAHEDASAEEQPEWHGGAGRCCPGAPPAPLAGRARLTPAPERGAQHQGTARQAGCGPAEGAARPAPWPGRCSALGEAAGRGRRLPGQQTQVGRGQVHHVHVRHGPARHTAAEHQSASALRGSPRWGPAGGPRRCR